MTTATKSRKATAKVQKTVKVIARAQFKADSRKVCYRVRSSDGTATYTTCLFNGKATGCDCPASKPCYHMTQLEAKEAARAQNARRETALAQAAESSKAALAQLDEETKSHIEEEKTNAVANPRKKSEQAAIAQDDWVPVYEPRTEADAKQGFRPHDAAYFNAKYASKAERKAKYDREVARLAEERKRSEPEKDWAYEAWKQANGLGYFVGRAQYCAMFDPNGLDLL